MNLEKTLAAELVAVARGVDAPPPPAVAELVRDAGRRRTRSRLRFAATSVLVAAAVVAAVVLGSQVGRPSATPGPTHPSSPPTTTATPAPLPTGEPPRIAYVGAGHHLHLPSGAPIGGTWWSAVTHDGYTVAVRPGGKMHRGQPVLFRDGVETDLLRDAAVDAIFSPDGRKLAWVEQSGSSAYLVVYDLRLQREQGRLPIDPNVVASDNEAEENVVTVDDSGTVTYGSMVGWYRWTPGGARVALGRPTHATLLPTGFPQDAEAVVLSPGGRFGAWVTDQNGQVRRGDRAPHDGVTVQQPGQPGTRFTIALPGGNDAGTIAWESATDLLVSVPADPDLNSVTFLRCHVATRACEVAPAP